MTAAYKAEDFAECSKSGEAPVGGFWRRHFRFGLTPRGTGGADIEFCRSRSWGRSDGSLLASLGSVGVCGNGGDYAVHFVIHVVHVAAILEVRES